MITPPVPGQRVKIDGNLVRSLVNQANRADKIRGGPGVITGRNAAGTQVGLSEAAGLLTEPAHIVDVVNEGEEAIPALGIAGITGHFFTKSVALQNRRVMTVRKPEAEDAGKLVITLDRIGKNQVGRACISGVCLCMVLRWFDDVFLNRADVYADQDYALCSAQGSLQILWEKTDDDGDLEIDDEHLAIVKFTDDFQALPFRNNGTVTAPFGSILVPEGTTGISANKLSAQRPDVDSSPSVYVVVGGDVAAGSEGSVILAEGAFMAQVDQAVSPGDDLGTKENQEELYKDQLGFRPLAYLGTHSGLWGVLHRTPFSGLVDVEFINRVNEALPDTVYQNDGNVQYTEANEMWCFLKFERPIPVSRLRAVITDGTPTMTFGMASRNDGGNLTGWSMGVSFAVVVADWDPAALTWNNKPATSFTNYGGSLALGVGDSLASEAPANAIDFDVTTGLPSHFIAAGGTGVAYGFAVRLTGSWSGANLSSKQVDLTCTKVSSYGIHV